MPKVSVQTETGVDASIEIVSGESKKNPGKTWTGISVKVGEWSTLVFPKSSFEMKYIKEQLGYE